MGEVLRNLPGLAVTGPYSIYTLAYSSIYTGFVNSFGPTSIRGDSIRAAYLVGGHSIPSYTITGTFAV